MNAGSRDWNIGAGIVRPAIVRSTSRSVNRLKEEPDLFIEGDEWYLREDHVDGDEHPVALDSGKPDDRIGAQKSQHAGARAKAAARR